MSRDEQLDELLDRWETSKERGQSLSAEELCADFPELLEELKRHMRELEAFDDFLEATVDSPVERQGGTSFKEYRVGRYFVRQFYKRGGFGEVFFAKDEELEREVALKRLSPRVAWNEDARKRFLLEAKVTGRLEHPGIVPVYGLGRDHHGDPYYAMRFIRGKTLDQAVEDHHAGRGMSLVKLLRSFQLACQAIAYAHSRDVIHRDIKPTNIIVGDYGEVLVIDWGLAKVGVSPAETDDSRSDPGFEPAIADAIGERTASVQAAITHPGKVAGGTPEYMSPEQARGEAVGPTNDVFGLGATLYKLLTGRVPYPGEDVFTKLTKASNHELVSPREANSAVPPALEAICLKAMAKDPGQRYQTAKELADDVDRWVEDQPVTAWQEPWGLRVRRWIRKHRTLVTSGLSALVVGLLLLLAFAVRLNAANQELNVANQNLKVANQRLDTKNEELEKTNADLQQSLAREKTEFERAQQYLKGSFGQVVRLMGTLNHPELQRPQNSLIYGALMKTLIPEFEALSNLVDKAPLDAEFKLNVLTQRDVFRISMALFTGQIEAEHLSAAQQNLQRYLETHQQDEWAEFNLALSHYLEANLQALSGQSNTSSLEAAYARFAKYASPNTPTGREVLRFASNVLMQQAQQFPVERTEPSAEIQVAEDDRARRIVQEIQRTLEAYDQAEPLVPAEGDAFNQMVWQRSMLLAAQANLQRRVSPEASPQTAQAAADMLARTSPTTDAYPQYFRARWVVQMALVDCRGELYTKLERWLLLSNAADDLGRCLQLMPHLQSESDRQALVAMERRVASTGVVLAAELKQNLSGDPSQIEQIVARTEMAIQRINALDAQVQEAPRAPK